MRKIGLLLGVACVGFGIWACSSDSTEDSAAGDAGIGGDGSAVKDSSGPVSDSGVSASDTGVEDSDGGSLMEDSGPTVDGAVPVGDSGTGDSGLIDSGIADAGIDTGPADSGVKFTVSGTVTGLSGTLVLQNNGAEDMTFNADGTFAFASQYSGSSYAVTVKTQPTSPTLQECVVSGNGSGTLTADVSGVTVTCTTKKFTVGGTVTGYKGFGLVLQNNLGDDVAITGDGTFNFTEQNSNSGYSVTVKTSPYAPIQSCVLANDTGTVGGTAVNNVSVTCSANALLAEYRFDEGTGTAALDSSGNGNNGVHNATYFATGKHGKALQMNGSQGVTVDNSPSWGASNADYTVEYWMYLLATNGNWVALFHKSNAAGADATRNPAHFFGPSTTLLYPCIGTSADTNFYGSTTNAWAVGAWTHLATVHSGTSQIVYRDGVAIKTDTLPGTTIGGAGKLYIGKDPFYSGVNGYMDEVRVYGRALSQAEIQRDMQ